MTGKAGYSQPFGAEFFPSPLTPHPSPLECFALLSPGPEF